MLGRRECGIVKATTSCDKILYLVNRKPSFGPGICGRSSRTNLTTWCGTGVAQRSIRANNRRSLWWLPNVIRHDFYITTIRDWNATHEIQKLPIWSKTSAKAETSVRGLPLGPLKGVILTAAVRSSFGAFVRSAFKNKSKLFESSGENVLHPIPLSFGCSQLEKRVIVGLLRTWWWHTQNWYHPTHICSQCPSRLAWTQYNLPLWLSQMRSIGSLSVLQSTREL